MAKILRTELKPFSILKLRKYGELGALLLNVDLSMLDSQESYENIVTELTSKMILTVPTFDRGHVRNIQPAKVKFVAVYMNGFSATVDIIANGSYEVLSFYAIDASHTNPKDSTIFVPDDKGVLSVQVEYMRDDEASARSAAYNQLIPTYRLARVLEEDIQNWNGNIDSLVRQHLEELKLQH